MMWEEASGTQGSNHWGTPYSLSFFGAAPWNLWFSDTTWPVSGTR